MVHSRSRYVVILLLVFVVTMIGPPRPTLGENVGKDVDKKFEALLKDWSAEGWKETDGTIEKLFGWSVTRKYKFMGLRLTNTLTFVPILYAGNEKKVIQLAGKIVSETIRKVRNDDGSWVQKFLPEDNAYAVVAELHGERQLSPQASYSLAMDYFDQCLQLEKAASIPLPLIDEKIDLDCDDPEVPKDSDGDLVADGGLTDAEVEGYLEEPECVTVWKTDPDTGEKYKDEECK